MSAQGWVITLSILAILMLVERFFAIRKNIKTYDLADFMVNLSCGILERVFAFFWYFVFFIAAQWVFDNVSISWHIPSNAFTWVLAVVAADFAAYWHHRLSHEINFLWAAHIVHHQSEDINISTVFRVSFFAVFNRSFFFIWLPVMGFSPEMSLFGIMFVGAFQFVTHSRVVGKLGFLENIFSTPSNHRVHHARNEKYIDHNYGHVLILWDKIFKTYTPEEEEPEYGITTGFESDDAYNAHFFYWKDMFKRAKLASSFKDKVKIFFAKPQWTPADVGYLPNQYKTDKNGNRLQHQTPMSKEFGAYMLINNIFTLGLFVAMFALVPDYKDISTSLLFANRELMILVGVIFFSVWTHGRFLDNKAGSRILDSIRLILVAVFIPLVFESVAFEGFNLVVWAFSAAMLAWLWLGNKITHIPSPAQLA
ncbi:MAG: sterol desaturase family protein [Flavobacteriales bacterium]|nr:sterol desaturase family protein [Flavobacteriales bacterium]